MYQMYNPSLLKIEVLKLEKSIDEDIYYLRYGFYFILNFHLCSDRFDYVLLYS